mgnify:CR=1 FL=1
MGFSRQKYCSGLPFPSPGYLPYPGTEPGSPSLEAVRWGQEMGGQAMVQEGPWEKAEGHSCCAISHGGRKAQSYVSGLSP